MSESHQPVRVITYGTFDLLHQGHIRLLQRAKDLGDYLIVGVTTDQYDANRGKLNVRDNLMTRIGKLQASGLADEIIIEDYEGQKINDIQQYGADIFAIGSDWLGKFDYLGNYCKVVYLDRTVGVSSTQLRAETLGITRLGIAGTGRISRRFATEALRVSGLEVASVYHPRAEAARQFAENNEIPHHSSDYEDLLDHVDAVYIASPHEHHAAQVRAALERGIHVLAEKPLTLTHGETRGLYQLARDKRCVLLEGIKTAYCPGFIRLVALARSGIIGDLKCVDATFTKLAEDGSRETLRPYGGSVTELASYPLLAISKILDTEPEAVSFESIDRGAGDCDGFTRINLRFKHSIASATVGLGAKSEGHLTIAGTAGSIYVPAPWWKTTDIYAHFEDQSKNQSYRFPFEGEGLRYEIAEFTAMIRDRRLESYKMRAKDSTFISAIVEAFRSGDALLQR